MRSRLSVRPRNRSRIVVLAIATLLGLAVVPVAVSRARQPAHPWLDAFRSPETRAAALVARMTLGEKISQMHTISGGGNIARLVPGIPRLGVPELRTTN
jgi:hypothetical protein